MSPFTTAKLTSGPAAAAASGRGRATERQEEVRTRRSSRCWVGSCYKVTVSSEQARPGRRRFGQSDQEYVRSLPRGAAVGPLRAKVLCRHVSKSGHVRHYPPVAEVRGDVIICNGNHLPLSSATGGPPLYCPGCPGRERYLDPPAIRRRVYTRHTGVLVLDADDVSTEVAALDPES